jgi:hypothetical protein
MLRSLANDPRDVHEIDRLKLSLTRRGAGGRVRLGAVREGGTDQAAVESSLERALDPIAEPFKLRPRIKTRLAGTARGEAR